MGEDRPATHTAFGLRLALEPALDLDTDLDSDLDPYLEPDLAPGPALAAPPGGRLGGGATGVADLVLAASSSPPAGWDSARPVAAWDSPDLSGGRPLMRLERRAPDSCPDPGPDPGRSPDRSWWRLSFQGAGDFYVSRRRVVQVVAPGDSRHLAELRLLGPVLAFWLELRGLPTLHGAAVVPGGRDGAGGPEPAVAFLARHGGGKSTLAAAFLEHGDSLLTDDLLALEGPGRDGGGAAGGFRALPAIPQLRLWTSDAQRFTGAAGRCPRVLPEVDKRRVAVGGDGFGRFHRRPAPLAALLVPRRLAPGEGGGVRFEPVSPAAALHLLVEHSYLRRLVTGAGLQPDRLTTLARLVETVPMYRLLYPPGFHRLGAVVARVKAWLAAWPVEKGVGGERSVGEVLEIPLQGVAHHRRRVGARGEG